MNTGILEIKTKDLSFSVEGLKILKEVSLEINSKEVIGIIGPNGSGKTTLVKHLYRALEPKKNVVYISGKELEKYSQKELATHITVMCQENHSQFEYNVLEMVMMGRSPYCKSFENYSEIDKQKAFEALAIVGMLKWKDKSFVHLSGGEKQRVLIARSLTQDTEIFLLDEPTNHLDIYYQLYLMQMIKKLNKTIVSVFHELNLAAQFCTKLYVLNHGKIIKKGTPMEVFTKELFQEVFSIDVDIFPLENGKVHIVYKEAI